MLKNYSSVFVYNIKWIYISKAITQILSFMIGILIIRRLTVNIFGTYTLLINVFIVFQIISLSAISNVFYRYIPELLENREIKKLEKLVKYSFILSSIPFLAFYGPLLLYKSEISRIINIENFESYCNVFILYCFVCYLELLIQITLKSLLLNKHLAIITIMNTLFRLLIYIILLNKLDVNYLLYVESVLAVIFIIEGYIVYRKHIGKIKNNSILLKDNNKTIVSIQRIRKYAIYSMFNELGVGIIGKTSGYFIVAVLSNSYNVGLYAFAQKIYETVFKILPFKEFQSVIRPIYFQRYGSGYDSIEIKRIYEFMLKVLLPIYTIPAIYFLIFGKHIIYLIFDPKYNTAYSITVILLFSNIFLAYFFPINLFAQLKERMDIIFYGKVATAVNVILEILAMLKYGLLGLVVATTLGSFINNIVILLLMKKYVEISNIHIEYKNYLLLILLLSPFMLVHYLEITYLSMILGTIIFTIYAYINYIIFNPFNKYDHNIIDKIAKSSSLLYKIITIMKSINNKFKPLKVYLRHYLLNKYTLNSENQTIQ